MIYIATYYISGRRELLERRHRTLDAALSFMVHGMAFGKHFVGTIMDHRRCMIASHD